MKNIFAICLFAMLLFASCTQEISLNLKGVEPELVVDGEITSDLKFQTIVLKKSGDYFMNSNPAMITGASVTVTDGTTSYSFIEKDLTKPGEYVSTIPFAGVVGKTYTLQISNLDVNNDGVKENYSSVNRMLPDATVDSISVVKQRNFFQDMWAVKVSMQELKGNRDFYLMRIYKNNELVSDSISEWGVTADDFFANVYLKNESVMYFRGRKPDERLVSGDSIKLEVCGISEDYLRFIEEVRAEFFGRNPLFGGQPANIRTNIVRTYPESKEGKGARGYFAVYSVSWGRTKYEE